MRTETIDKENLAATEWDENYFKLCDFRDFSMEGGIISSDFVSCSLKNVEWYWGLFSCSNFIECRFTDCVFRGSSFFGCRFVDCVLSDCRFIKDNLDADCGFSGTVAFGCSIQGGEGFKAEMKG